MFFYVAYVCSFPTILITHVELFTAIYHLRHYCYVYVECARLFYLFIDVSTVILVEIFVDILVKFMFWFLLELGNLFWFASMQFSC